MHVLNFLDLEIRTYFRLCVCKKLDENVFASKIKLLQHEMNPTTFHKWLLFMYSSYPSAASKILIAEF